MSEMKVGEKLKIWDMLWIFAKGGKNRLVILTKAPAKIIQNKCFV